MNNNKHSFLNECRRYETVSLVYFSDEICTSSAYPCTEPLDFILNSQFSLIIYGNNKSLHPVDVMF